MATLDLPTYVSISEATKRYQLGREALTHLIETGKVRAVKVDGNFAVAEEDIGAVRTSDLPTYVSISEAAKRYHLGHEALTHLVEAGKVRAVEVDESIAVAKEDIRLALIQLEIKPDENLRGQPIRATEAAKRYEINERTLGRWAESGHIQVIERGPKLLVLDEADVKLAAEVYKLAYQETGSAVRAGWVLKRTLKILQE